jgi:NADH-quinone oxidoreductase subunit D
MTGLQTTILFEKTGRLKCWIKRRLADMAYEKEFRIPIGPQHPALKEPASFSLALKGEKILGVDIRLGYNHRGIEKACEERTYVQDLYLIERICGICSHAHSTCFVQAVEEIAGLRTPPRALYIRTLIGELERIHSHLLWLGVAAHEIGFDTLLMYSWRDREVVMDVLAAVTGNRVNYGINTIGGVRRDINADQAKEILKAMDILEDRTKYYIEIATQETTIVNRLSGVGVISHEDAIRLGAVGPTARASGVDRDIRRDDPYAAYDKLSFNVITDDHNDVYGRAVVRLKELMESYKIIRQAVQNIPEGPISVKAPRKIPAGDATSRYEAPRGEDMHYVKANGTDKPERIKVRAPTLANLQSVKTMLRDRYLADMPIVVAAIDPCFSCTDRLITIEDLDKKSSEVIDWKQLREYSIEWYKNKGIDLSKVRIR